MQGLSQISLPNSLNRVCAYGGYFAKAFTSVMRVRESALQASTAAANIKPLRNASAIKAIIMTIRMIAALFQLHSSIKHTSKDLATHRAMSLP